MNQRKNKKVAQRAVSPAVFPQATSCFTVAIVGGGASGIAAACAIATGARTGALQLRVVLIEKGRKIGSSILRSGNGRCNFSHANIEPGAFNQPSFVDAVFRSLEDAYASSSYALSDHVEQVPALALRAPAIQSNAVLRWFSELGLVWQEAPHTDGLLYPFSNKATSVLEVLQAELDRCGVECACGIEVTRIEKENDRFSLWLQDALDSARSSSFVADAVIFAAGGQAADPLCSSGIIEDAAFTSFCPVLGPLRTDTRFLEGLDGVRVRAHLSCSDGSFSEEGEVLFRTYGISGIVVFNASRYVEAGDVIVLDLAPDLSPSNLNELLIDRVRSYESRTGKVLTYEGLLRGFFLPELAAALLRYSDFSTHDLSISLDRRVEEHGIEQVASCIKHFELAVAGGGDEKQCQVHRGGFRVGGIDSKTMEVTCVPGLYVTGEALDIDGPCGGFNLHWAWASGLLAGLSIVHRASGCLNEDVEAGEREGR